MADYKFKGNFRSEKMECHVVLSLISFIEDEVNIIYSPALDLSGYGKTEPEAKESFQMALNEFIRYTSNKGTFNAELEKMGWKISHKKTHPTYIPPYLDELLGKNNYLSEVVRNKDFNKFNQQITIPAFS